ncbi:MAG: TrmB family transcriptional regulator [FCB group bacterium]|nr:TrmB family transcriptional regulator [FCB group bacterium]
MDSQLIEKLNQFGFTKNESKAYIALLKQYPATGYEISQRSGVPRSAIYDVLKRLELQGIVSNEGEKPVTYVPINPEQFKSQLTSRFEHNIHQLSGLFSSLNCKSGEESTWNIKGYTALIDQARSLIDGAESTVFCSIWEREYLEVKNQLNEALLRGVDVVCFSFCNLNHPSHDVLTYGIDESKLREIWHRQIVLIADKKVAVLGGADRTPENRSIRTDNPAILNIAINYLILDITLLAERKGINAEPIIAKLMNEQSEGLENLLEI